MKTLCLNMIVKNESKIITRCLDSVKDYIDYFVICDTGSTDGTQDIIKDYFKKHNIKSRFYSRMVFLVYKRQLHLFRRHK